MLRKRAAAEHDETSTPDLPIEKVAIGLYTLIVVFGWCAMANAYHSETVGRPEVLITASDLVSSMTMVIAMFWTFVTSSLLYLGSFPSVIAYTFTQKLSIPITMVVVAVGVRVFTRWTKTVSSELEQGFEHSKHRRTR